MLNYIQIIPIKETTTPMSERQSFDPLAEARMNADPQRQKFYEAIGSDPDTNRDYAAYLETRNYKDEKGNIHDAATGNFTTAEAPDTYDADLYASAYKEAASLDKAYDGLRDLSLKELAQTVAHLREKDEIEASREVENVFFDKFSEMSDKYKWEEEVTENTEEPRVDKNAQYGRDTVDARLERFTKIMYGDESEGAKNNTDTATAPSNSAESVIDDSDPELQAQNVVEQFSELSDEQKAKILPHIDSIGEETQDDNAHDTLDDSHDDNIIIPPLNFASDSPANVTPSRGRDTIIPPLKFDDVVAARTATPDQDTGKTAENNQDLESKPTWKGLLERTRLRAKTAAGSAYFGSRELLGRGYNKLRNAQEKEDEKESKTKKRVLIGLGVVATGVAIALLVDQARKHGFDVMPEAFDGNGFDTTPDNTGGVTSPEAAPVTPDLTPDAAPTAPEYTFSESARTIDGGEGWNRTMQELGIPSGQWNSILNEAGPDLVNDGSAYYDTAAGEYRMKLGNGQLSERSLVTIAEAAKSRGISIG